MSLGLVTSFFVIFSVQTYLKGVVPPVGHNAAHALTVIPHTLKVKIDHLNNIDEVYGQNQSRAGEREMSKCCKILEQKHNFGKHPIPNFFAHTVKKAMNKELMFDAWKY